MAIFYNYTITVNGNKASMDKNIYLYRKNKNVDYYFEIKNACFKFENEINYIISYNAEYARFRVIKPDGTKFFTEKRKVEDGYAKFSVTEDLIDERAEVGTYVFQIDLYDEDDGFITIPPIYNQFHVLEPLFDEDDSEIGQVDITGVDISYVGDVAEEVTIFDENGIYVKTFWKTADIISSVRMNKIEEGIHSLSEKISDLTYKPISITSFRSNLSKTVYEKGVETINGCTFTWTTSMTPKSISLTDCTIGVKDTSYTYNTTISDTKTFTLSVTDSKNNTRSSSITFSFVYPFYYGTFIDSLTETNIKAGTKLVEIKGNKSINLSYSDKRVFYAYPKSYGELKSIKDGNGFEYLNDFDKEEININNVNYYIYKIKNKASVSQIKYTFSF